MEECSGCGKKKMTVYRYQFDGMCADCTDNALWDEDFADKAKENNKELIGTEL